MFHMMRKKLTAIVWHFHDSSYSCEFFECLLFVWATAEQHFNPENIRRFIWLNIQVSCSQFSNSVSWRLKFGLKMIFLMRFIQKYSYRYGYCNSLGSKFIFQQQTNAVISAHTTFVGSSSSLA